MKKQTRYKRRRVRGGAKQSLTKKKITFTLFVGDDGLYLQEPKVEGAMFASNLKKGTKLTKSNRSSVINDMISKTFADYDMDSLKTVYNKESATPPTPAPVDSATTTDANTPDANTDPANYPLIGPENKPDPPSKIIGIGNKISTNVSNAFNAFKALNRFKSKPNTATTPDANTQIPNPE